jgi:hypothetical protein
MNLELELERNSAAAISYYTGIHLLVERVEGTGRVITE